MLRLVGREREREVLDGAMTSRTAELVAVYGRRRVGKTFLVRRHLADDLCFELTGMFGVSLRHQLRNFADALAASFNLGVRPAPPIDWMEAFAMLATQIERLPKRKRKRVVFLDELPWLAGRRSGFLSAFEHFCNAWASRRDDLVVVVCGSAASWMIRELLRARGGLHNRVTRSLRLEPFTVKEANAFLVARDVKLESFQVLELYMALGGVPMYLAQIERGESPAQCIDRTCFASDGMLRNEFDQVYTSLFESADRHEQIVRVLSTRRQGLTRTELLAATKLPSGGWLTDVLEELEESGFVMRTGQFGRPKNAGIYRLADEHSLFHLRWIERHRGRASGAWLRARGSPTWRAWSGYSFEGLCLKHIDELRWALGIGAVQTEESTWRHRATSDDDDGAQIDLVIDRADGCINLCEMKFVEGDTFAIDKTYAQDLARKREVFRRETRTRKTLFTTLVTTHGLASTKHLAVADAAITVDALFK